MSEELMVRHCAPTLAGLKAGSLFSCDAPCPQELKCQIRALNRKLVPKGLRVLPLRVRSGRALIYVYRPSGLQRSLDDAQARQLLQDYGYSPANAEGCLLRLAQRLRNAEEFPHEIGLFLGYPPKDVRGFIEHRDCDLKCIGCWKVYGDKEKAQKTFRQFRKCSRIYRQKWEEGTPIERLTVADRRM